MTADELDELVEERVEEAITLITGEDDVEVDRLWRSVGTSLRAAKARLVIAMDETTPSIERIFHFLARSSSLDVQLFAIQRYSSGVGEIVVSKRRVNPTFERKSPDDGPKPRPPVSPGDDDRIITVVATENPKKEGSAARGRFKLYRQG